MPCNPASPETHRLCVHSIDEINEISEQTFTLHDVEDLYPRDMLLRTPLESRWMKFWRNYNETLSSFFNHEDLPILLAYLTIIFIALFVLGFAINILQWMWM